MIGIDTNVLVRYLTQDDASQALMASTFIESLSPSAPGYVTTIALAELVWVLESCYQVDRAAMTEVVSRLLRTKEIVLEQSESVARALRTYTSGKQATDFSDCLISQISADAGCSRTVTFDRGAVKAGIMHALG